MIIAVPTNMIQDTGINRLKVFSNGPDPAILRSVRIIKSREAGELADAFSPIGNLIIDPNSPGAQIVLTGHTAAEQQTIELIRWHAADNLLTPIEKSTWRNNWQRIEANYNRSIAYAQGLFDPDPPEVQDMIDAYDTLYALLDEYGVFAEAYRLFPANIDGQELETKYKAYSDAYQILSEICMDKVAEKKASDGADGNVEDVLTKWGWIVPDTTKIDGGLIETNTIRAGSIQAKSIGAEQLAADSITAEEIKAGEIQTEHLGANTINAGHIQAGSITAEKIQAEALHADKITGDIVKGQPFFLWDLKEENGVDDVVVQDGQRRTLGVFVYSPPTLPQGVERLPKVPFVTASLQVNNATNGGNEGMGAARVTIRISAGGEEMYNEYAFLVYGTGTGTAVTTVPWDTTGSVTVEVGVYNGNCGPLTINNINGTILMLR